MGVRNGKSPLLPCWSVVEEPVRQEDLPSSASRFTLGNGWLGIRGGLEEGWPGGGDDASRGTYLNGVYDSEPIRYPEHAYGYARMTQTMLRVPDGMRISLAVDGERFSVCANHLLGHRRELNMRSGQLLRTVTWRTRNGKHVGITVRRIVSLTCKHVAALRYTVTILDDNGRIVLDSLLDGDVHNQAVADDPRTGTMTGGKRLVTEHAAATGATGWLQQKTRRTGFHLLCGMTHACRPSRCKVSREISRDRVNIRFAARLKRGVPFVLDKFLVYHASREEEPARLAERMQDDLMSIRQAGFDGLVRQQQQALDQFWAAADVCIDGDPDAQQAIRFNVFHLLQAAGSDGKTSIGAKGLSGEGYEGHYFWDTDVYMLPFFIYTRPDIARALLQFRHGTLVQAKQRARELAARGALYPWRTINGEEASAYFPAGTAQVHINADIVYGIHQYWTATGDDDFLARCGVEIAVETARFWLSCGFFNPHANGKFCIHGVTGPDEYTVLVNNNAYTNLMARHNLLVACEYAEWLETNRPADYVRLREKKGLEEQEIGLWRKAALSMYVPRDDERGIIAQDDSFLDRETWPSELRAEGREPLLLGYHPLVIYRHQVLKQADVILALVLLADQFTVEEKKRNYVYYEPLTTHDSSLSKAVHGIVAAEIGLLEEACEAFRHTVRIDLDDRNGNTKDGLHMAAMGGAWLALVRGFAGMRPERSVLSFSPRLPDPWNRYAFRIRYRGCLLECEVKKREVVYRLINGKTMRIAHRGTVVTLRTDQPAVFPE